MRAIVIDASAALAILLSEPAGEATASRLEAWKRADVPMFVPSHFWLEVANALSTRRHLPGDVVVEAIHRLDEFGLETVEVGRPVVLLALALGEQFRLSLYDAAYLAVAETENAHLLTGDRSLQAAAPHRAIALDGGGRFLREAPVAYASRGSWASYRETAALLASFRADAEAAATARS